MTTDTGLALTPEKRFDEVPRPFAVLVPGGPGSVAAMGERSRSRATSARRRRRPRSWARSARGALVLAATGLLEGRRATTHWAYAAELEKLGARYVRERFVEDGKFITGGGVSAGIDMALAPRGAAHRPRHRASASSSASSTTPTRPSAASTGAGSARRSVTRQRQGGTGRRLQDAPRLLAGRPDLLDRLGLVPR